MTPEKRQEKLLKFIMEKHTASKRELVDVVNCSYPTLCRDLNALEDRHEIRLSYGGATYIGRGFVQSQAKSTASTDYYMYEARKQICYDEKMQIGLCATQLISQNDVIFITHGTTTDVFAQSLDPNIVLTVITDGIDIINSLSDHPNIRVFATGGLLNYKSRQIEHNPYMSGDMSKININKLIMGIGGISLSNGITFYDFNSFKFLEQLIDCVNEIIVLADSSKIGYVGLANFISIDKITTFVTDSHADHNIIREIEKMGVRCLIAGGSDD